MTDEERKALVERLRGRTSCNEILLVHPPRPAPDRDCHYAADQIEADGQRIAELEAALREVMPFIVTQAIGCHGDKCRKPWCYSCYDEDEAYIEADKGHEAYKKARAALGDKG